MDNEYLAIWVIVALLVGGAFGGVGFSKTDTVVEFVDKEIIKEVEVLKYINETVNVDKTDFWFDKAYDNFWASLEDEEDEAGNDMEWLLSCGNESYDFEDISLSKLGDEWGVWFSDDEVIVDFVAKLKYKEDGEKSCRAEYHISTHWEEDEDTGILVRQF